MEIGINLMLFKISKWKEDASPQDPAKLKNKTGSQFDAAPQN